jgi:archaemetzincin
MDRLHLIPIGEIESAILEEVARSLEQIFGIHVRKEKPMAVPSDTFKAFREQYHSTSLLQRLRISYPFERGSAALLGIIDRDLFVPELNFVFGEADAATQTAIISLARLRTEFYGLPPDDELLKSRAIKEAVHEMGHMYGLTHCPDPECVMFFSNRLEDTDTKGTDLCRLHRDRLGAILTKV